MLKDWGYPGRAPITLSAYKKDTDMPDVLGWLLFAWVLVITPQGEYTISQKPTVEFATAKECKAAGHLIMAEEQGLIYQCQLKRFHKEPERSQVVND